MGKQILNIAVSALAGRSLNKVTITHVIHYHRDAA